MEPAEAQVCRPAARRWLSMGRVLLILGCNGQLARALRRAAASRYPRVLCVGRDDVDLSVPGEAARAIGEAGPDVVINAAAFTAVDAAEDQVDAARRLNADAAGEAARAARAGNARFVHVSTDYVFGGDGRDGPFDEAARPTPVNVYGATKLEGEQQVLSVYPGAAVVRSSAIFSGLGRDFPSTIWRLGFERQVIEVVDDQLTGPTFADDLAAQLVALAEIPDAHGVFHSAGVPHVSWAQFAAAALEVSARSGGPSAEISPVATNHVARPAPRPRDSRLSDSRLVSTTGLALSDWRAGLQRALDVWRMKG